MEVEKSYINHKTRQEKRLSSFMFVQTFLYVCERANLSCNRRRERCKQKRKKMKLKFKHENVAFRISSFFLVPIVDYHEHEYNRKLSKAPKLFYIDENRVNYTSHTFCHYYP